MRRETRTPNGSTGATRLRRACFTQFAYPHMVGPARLERACYSHRLLGPACLPFHHRPWSASRDLNADASQQRLLRPPGLPFPHSRDSGGHGRTRTVTLPKSVAFGSDAATNYATYPSLVRAGGLEPPRRFRQSLLRRSRLPFRHTRMAAGAGLEPASNSLTARCMTVMLPGIGGDAQNRTEICCLQSSGPTIERHPHGAPKWIQTTGLRVRSAALSSS